MSVQRDRGVLPLEPEVARDIATRIAQVAADCRGCGVDDYARLFDVLAEELQRRVAVPFVLTDRANDALNG